MFEFLGLFLGAFFDALIGPNFFVLGEPFYLAAGYQLYNGVITGVLLVLLGGLLGDQLSYFIGQKFGKPAQQKLIKWKPKTRRSFARCRRLMATKNIFLLTFARLLGPVAWVVPFMAGMQRIPWSRFSFFSGIGLLLGGGQCLFWGYLLAAGVDKFPLLNSLFSIISEHKYSLIAVAVTLIFAWIGYRLQWKQIYLKAIAFFIAAMLVVNYNYYFLYADNFFDNKPLTQTTPSSLNYKAYSGKSSFFDDAQGINLLYVGESPKNMMEKLGWLENKTFSRNDLDWSDYVNLIKKQTPPVSDLFWNGRPQDMAFQLPGDLIKRSHIRWWFAGIDEKKQPIWAGAISYDDGLTLTLYSGIITVLHSIDPDIDKERDKLANQISEKIPALLMEYYQAMHPLSLDDNHDYYSDGRILLLQADTNHFS